MARKLGDKDKTKRKSRGLLTNTALLGGATALGGYIVKLMRFINTILLFNCCWNYSAVKYEELAIKK
jgi:hypothetical protein